MRIVLFMFFLHFLLFSGKIHDVLQTDSGAGSQLDNHILLLNERLRLGSAVHQQLREKPGPRDYEVNWTHFGGKHIFFIKLRDITNF